jgi:hypothetical protein
MAFFRTRRTRDLLVWMLSTRMMPAVGALVPIYVLAQTAGLLDSLSALTVVFTLSNLPINRITPRPTPDVRERVKAATGVDDAAALMAEDFIQWVIEDRFCNGRPAWERVGVLLVDSVAPYEEAKIRILNATHGCIAWAGALVGHRFIHAPGFIVPTIRERMGRGELPYAYRDQAMDAAAAHAICAAADPLAAFARDPVLWGPLAGDPTLSAALAAAYREVQAFVAGPRG